MKWVIPIRVAPREILALVPMLRHGLRAFLFVKIAIIGIKGERSNLNGRIFKRHEKKSYVWRSEI